MRSITIVVLPKDKGWCFSTKHTDLEIAGAVPITYYLDSGSKTLRNKTLDDIYEECKFFWGDLYFNPIPELEPDYSVVYVDEMKDWWSDVID